MRKRRGFSGTLEARKSSTTGDAVKAFEQFFEGILWNSRLIVLIPALIGLVLAVGMFLVTTIDGIALVGQMFSYLNPTLDESARTALRLETISEIVAIVDGYLLAAIMIIFSLGIYELFVNKIDRAENSEFATRLLLIRSLDDLKDRLANVILLILIVKFFQQALSLKYESPSDLLILAVGIVLIAGTLYLSGRANPRKTLTVKDESK